MPKLKNISKFRVAMGLCEGVTFPAISSMMARWAPVQERSIMSTLIMAGSQVYLQPRSDQSCQCSSWQAPRYISSTGEINHLNAHHGRIPDILYIQYDYMVDPPVQERSIMSTLIMPGPQVYLQHNGMVGPSTVEINHFNANHGRVPGISPL
jgi:hypothetical protein